MPRHARIALADVPAHLIQRGNNRQPCFYADEDYLRYLDWLAEYAIKWGCRVHAYVLMTNHVHLLITPEHADSAGLMMKSLGQRYIEMNPVRAAMVVHLAEYRWSSYRANAQGEAETDVLVQPHPVYMGLGTDAAARQAAYRELFRYELEPGLVDEIRRATNGNFALGGASFASEVALVTGRRVIAGHAGRPHKES